MVIHLFFSMDGGLFINIIKLSFRQMVDLVYLVIEYMEHDLTGLLSQPNADFPESVIKSYMMQLLEGLAYLHGKSVIHRDIKGKSPELWTL